MITIIPGTGVPYQLPTVYNSPALLQGDLGLGALPNLIGSAGRSLTISAGVSPEVFGNLEIQGARSATNSAFGNISFYHKTDQVAAITATRQSADDEADLRISTKAASGLLTERLRVSPAGDLSTGATASSVTGADIFKNSAVDIALRVRNNQNSIDMMVANDGSGYFRLNGTNWLNIINSSSSFIMSSSGLIGVNGVSSGPNFDVRGSFGCRPPASITPVNNGDLVIQATSNTSLTFLYKGSDGTVRQGSITLA